VNDLEKRVIGRKIKLARIARGLSQTELCEKTGISRPTLTKLEREGTDDSGYIESLSKALEINVIDLEGESNGGDFKPSKLMEMLEQALQQELTEHDKVLTLEMLEWFKKQIDERGV